MATNTYLHCDPIKGESTDEDHKDWIEVFSFNHGLSQPMSGASGTGGRSSARADFDPFVITKSIGCFCSFASSLLPDCDPNRRFH